MAHVLGLGFSTVIADDPDFELTRRNLDEAVALGIEFVELPFFTFDLIAGGKVVPSQLRRLKEAVAGRGVGLTIHGPIAANFMQPPELVARHTSVARAVIEASAELGAAHIVFHTGRVATLDEADLEAAYAVQRRALAALGDHAAQHDIILVIENIPPLRPGEHTALPSRLAAEIETIGHPNVRGCLDLSHAFLQTTEQGADFLKEAEALARVSRHVHLHDSFGDPVRLSTVARAERAAYGIGDLHLPLGWGAIPWDRIMTDFTFEPDVIFNLELPKDYWFALGDCVARMRDLRAIYEEAQGARA